MKYYHSLDDAITLVKSKSGGSSCGSGSWLCETCYNLKAGLAVWLYERANNEGFDPAVDEAEYWADLSPGRECYERILAVEADADEQRARWNPEYDPEERHPDYIL